MKHLSKIALISLLTTIFVCNSYAQTTLRVCVDKNGAITARTKCPKNTQSLLLSNPTLKGVTGERGEKGDKGETGIQGLKGDKGDTGSQGLKGDKGDIGLTGPSGRPAVSYTSCRKVESQYSFTWNSTTPNCPIPSHTVMCNDNEYLYYGRKNLEFTSNNLVINTYPQSSWIDIAQIEAREVITDSEDMFPQGITTASGAGCDANSVITGNGVHNYVIHATCCLLDE